MVVSILAKIKSKKKSDYFIILGGGLDQKYLIENVKSLGYKIILFDKNKNCFASKKVNLFLNINFQNYKKIIFELKKLKKKNNIQYHGILTMGSDIPIILTKIAKALNLFSQNLYSAKVSQNKILMKKFFKKHKIKTPNFAIIDNFNKAKKFFINNKLSEVVIKPYNSSGSRGVFRIKNLHELKVYKKIIYKNYGQNKILIEEFIDGPQLSTESILFNGKIFTPGFSLRNYLDTKYLLPQIIENGGVMPNKLDRYRNKVEVIKLKLAKLLKINSGVIKGDFVLDKNNNIQIIEFTTRLSGGDFSESLAPLSNGINYVKELIKIYARKEITDNNLLIKKKIFCANRYFFTPPGKLQKIRGLNKIKKISNIKKLLFYYKVGEKVHHIDSHGKRLGVFVVTANSKEKLDKKIKKIYSTLNFKISNVWYKGISNKTI